MRSFIYLSQRFLMSFTLMHFAFETLLMPMLMQVNLIIPVTGQQEEIIQKSQPYIMKFVRSSNDMNQSAYRNNSNETVAYYPDTIIFQENKTVSYMNNSIPREKENPAYIIIEDPVKRFYVINSSEIPTQTFSKYIMMSAVSNQPEKNTVNFVSPSFFSTPSQFVPPVGSTVVVNKSDIGNINQVPNERNTLESTQSDSSNANGAFIVTKNSTVTNQAIIYKNATLNDNNPINFMLPFNSVETQPQWHSSTEQYTRSSHDSSSPAVSQNLINETREMIFSNISEPTLSSASHIVSSHEKNMTNIIFTNEQANMNEINDSYYILRHPVSVISPNESNQSDVFFNYVPNNQENTAKWQPIYANTPYIVKREARDDVQNNGMKLMDDISNQPFISREPNNNGMENNQSNISIENVVVHTLSEAPPLEEEKTNFSFYNISTPGLYKLQGTSLVPIVPDSIEALSIKTWNDAQMFSNVRRESFSNQTNESYSPADTNVPYSNVIYASSQSNFFPMDNMSGHSQYLQANDTILSNIILNHLKNDMVESLRKLPYNGPQTVTHSVLILPNEVASWSSVNDSTQQSNSNV